MKKKILISMLAIILLVVILFSLNYLRNYFILKDIYNKNNGYLNNANNFYYKETIHFFATNDIQESEVWYKDGIHLSIFSQNNQKSSLIWENSNTGDFFGGEYLENNTFQEFSKEQFKDYNPKETNTYSKILFDESVSFEDALKSNMFRFIPLTNNSYVIHTPFFQKTINKNSGLVEKITNVVVNARNSETTIIFNANVVTDENVIKPTI